MSTTVQRDVLLAVLGKVKNGVSKRFIPIAATILFQCDKRGITLTAYNGDAQVIGECKASLDKWAICVDPTALESFLKAVKVDTVALSVKGRVKNTKVQLGTVGEDGQPKYRTDSKYFGEMQVQAGTNSTVLQGMDPKEFPPVPKFPKAAPIHLTGLKESLDQVLFAAAKEDSRPVLQCVNFSPNSKGMVVVAADGFRLAIRRLASRGKLKKEALIHRDTAILLKKLLPDKSTLQVDDRHAFFRSNGMAVVSLITQGTFPNYHQLIPKDGVTLKVDAKQLLAAINVVASIKPDGGILRLTTRGGELKIAGKSGDNKEIKDNWTTATVPCKGNFAKGKIALNDKYLKDLVSHVEGELVLRTTAPSAPALATYGGTTHVVMPMFVQW